MNFEKDIYILNNLIRYSTTHTIVKESVASHSFFVAAIVMKLEEKYRFDTAFAVSMAVCHDLPEIELTDLPRPIKLKYPDIYAAYKSHEEEVINKMPSYVQKMLRHYRDKPDSEESLIVKLADTMQCLQFAQNEIALGNHGYTDEIVSGSYTIIHELEKRLKPYERN